MKPKCHRRTGFGEVDGMGVRGGRQRRSNTQHLALGCLCVCGVRSADLFYMQIACTPQSLWPQIYEIHRVHHHPLHHPIGAHRVCAEIKSTRLHDVMDMLCADAWRQMMMHISRVVWREIGGEHRSNQMSERIRRCRAHALGNAQ